MHMRDSYVHGWYQSFGYGVQFGYQQSCAQGGTNA
ncbi:Uncharacterised protein [Mycolicibacterium phlei]|nr:Uncharacterised protein [Mycolicibacterium phlei]